MHIFSDESGGTGDEEHFVVAAIVAEPHKLKRVEKKILDGTRKCSLEGEIKGTDLSAEQREIIINILLREMQAGAAVACRRADPLGGWAIKMLEDHHVWSQLTEEACGSLVTRFAVGGVMPDGGRHKRIQKNLEFQLAENLAKIANRQINVRMGLSHQNIGLQLADVLSNTVYRALKGEPFERDLVNRMQENGFLQLTDVQFEGRREVWHDALVETREDLWAIMRRVAKPSLQK